MRCSRDIMGMPVTIEVVGARQFDLIVSNPPLHSGFKEDLLPLQRLISSAPRFLSETGILLLVVQRRIGLDQILAESFEKIDIVADDAIVKKAVDQYAFPIFLKAVFQKAGKADGARKETR